MPSLLYDNAKKELCQGLISWDGNANIKVLLVNASYTASPSHSFLNEVTANELSGAGYARQTLASKTVTVDATNHRVICSAADLNYVGLNAGTLAAAIIFLDTGTAATSPLIAHMDAPDLTSNGSDVALRWSVSGLFSL